MRYLVVLLAFLFAAPALSEGPRELWLYYPVNLQVAENVPKLEQVWKRAKQAGYTHVLLADSKFAKLGDVPENYFKNIERVKAIAKQLDLKLVPAVFSVGYSNDLLWHDPNLAEGFPVKDTPFVVGPDGVAHVAPESKVALDKPSWKDDTVKLEGN